MASFCGKRMAETMKGATVKWEDPFYQNPNA